MFSIQSEVNNYRNTFASHGQLKFTKQTVNTHIYYILYIVTRASTSQHKMCVGTYGHFKRLTRLIYFVKDTL